MNYGISKSKSLIIRSWEAKSTEKFERFLRPLKLIEQLTTVKNTKECMSRYVQPNVSISDGRAKKHSPSYTSLKFWSQYSKFRLVFS